MAIYDDSLVEKGEHKSLTSVEKDLTYITLLKMVHFAGKELMVVGYFGGC